jgi:AcrR family transcriptional regulator
VATTRAADWPEPLPPGRHKLSREFVARSQRERMLAAMARACADKGFASVTIADIVARARVSREAFYAHFRDKEDCFLAAYDASLGQFLGVVIAAYEQKQLPWPERVRAAIRAMLSNFAADPAFTRLTMVEVLAAGPQAHQRYISAVRVLATLLEEGRNQTPNGPHLPPKLPTALIAGAALALREQVWAGRTAELERLEPDLLYTTLGPFIGQAEALRLAGRASGQRPHA